MEKIEGDTRSETLSPISFANNELALQFMQDLSPLEGQVYTLMVPDGLDSRGFVNWKTIIKRGVAA